MTEFNLIAINVGNSRTQIGLFRDGTLTHQEHFSHDDLSGTVERIAAWWEELAAASRAALAIASVNHPVSKRLTSAIEDQLSEEVYVIGEDIPIPIGERLDPETITGVDRLLNAAAAFAAVKQACITVDAGTAVTVDFVDGEGTFHGGAIAPGGRLQLHALAEYTDALPEVTFAIPESEEFGRSTAQAMLQGVYHGIRGMVWRFVEQYAQHYGAFPIVVATGGDAPMLFDEDELIDRIVPELTLQGILVAARHALTTNDADVAN